MPTPSDFNLRNIILAILEELGEHIGYSFYLLVILWKQVDWSFYFVGQSCLIRSLWFTAKKFLVLFSLVFRKLLKIPVGTTSVFLWRNQVTLNICSIYVHIFHYIILILKPIMSWTAFLRLKILTQTQYGDKTGIRFLSELYLCVTYNVNINEKNLSFYVLFCFSIISVFSVIWCDFYERFRIWNKCPYAIQAL